MGVRVSAPTSGDGGVGKKIGAALLLGMRAAPTLLRLQLTLSSRLREYAAASWLNSTYRWRKLFTQRNQRLLFAQLAPEGDGLSRVVGVWIVLGAHVERALLPELQV